MKMEEEYSFYICRWIGLENQRHYRVLLDTFLSSISLIEIRHPLGTFHRKRRIELARYVVENPLLNQPTDLREILLSF